MADFLNNVDIISFVFGIFLAYFMDILFSVANYFVQKALYARAHRRFLQGEIKNRESDN